MADHQLYHDERERIGEFRRRMRREGLAGGTGGTLSVRLDDDHVAVSPAGVASEEVDLWDVPVVRLDGTVVTGDREPTPEVPLHLGVYEHRPDVGGVIHTHSPYASAFAVLGDPVPASHYLVAFAGDGIPVADYATFGTPALGRAAVEALGDDHDATLLKNNGALATGADLPEAFTVARMVEYCARVHHRALAVGDPSTLSTEEVRRVREGLDAFRPTPSGRLHRDGQT